MRNFCIQCGNELVENSNFCSKCGKQCVSNKDNNQDTNQVTNAPRYKNIYDNNTTNNNYQNVYGNNNTNTNNNRYNNLNNNDNENAKSKVIAAVLALLFGWAGAHNFYLGYYGRAIAQLLLTILTCGIGVIVTGIWSFVEFILLLTGHISSDGKGIRLGD